MKGQILTEIEKLRNLDHHRRKLAEIQERDTRKAVKSKVARYDKKEDNKKHQYIKAVNNAREYILY